MKQKTSTAGKQPVRGIAKTGSDGENRSQTTEGALKTSAPSIVNSKRLSYIVITEHTAPRNDHSYTVSKGAAIPVVALRSLVTTTNLETKVDISVVILTNFADINLVSYYDINSAGNK